MGVGAQLGEGQQARGKQHHSLGECHAYSDGGCTGGQVECGVEDFEHAERLPHEDRSAWVAVTGG